MDLDSIMKNRSLSLTVLLLALVVSCVSTGAPKLSEDKVKTIVEGKSSKDDVIKLLGHPEQSLKLDKINLDNYINRVLATKVPEDMFPVGQYEIWTYNKWSYFAIDPLLIPSHESSKISLVIFDSNDICIKKFYDAESESKW